MADRIFLIDGHNLIFKMYYAFLRRPMINSKGADMSILFGFTKYILELLDREKPTHLAVAFDPPGGTFRDKLYPAYKANRAETPQLVIDALDPLIEICDALNITTLMLPGYEADDVIGSMSKRCAREGLDVYMVTPDKDYGQLIEDRIWQYKPGKGGSDNEVIGVPEIRAKYGIQSPLQVIDLLTLCGDASDNVPGVKGVGEVGASKLVAKYGSVQAIYAHLDELSPRQQAQFREAEDHIALSYQLVTIKTDLELDTETDEMKVNRVYGPEAANLFEKYEFRSLKRFIGQTTHTKPSEKPERLPFRNVAPAELIRAAEEAGRCALITEGRDSGLFTPLKRIVAAAPGKEEFLVAEGGGEDFKPLLDNPDITKCGDDFKRQINILAANGWDLAGKLMDIPLMHYLLDPEKSHKVDILAQSYLGISFASQAETTAATGSLFDENPETETEDDRGEEAAVLLKLGERILAEMREQSLVDLYVRMEEPLLRVLSEMEREGVKVDVDSLHEYAAGLRKEMGEREAKIRNLTGEPALNVSSPKQIGEVLFDKMGLAKKPKKNANGTYSTDETTLTDLAWKHPVINEILEFRAVKKLLSTYIEPFPGYIDPSDGKIHTTFNQALTATGRLSSSNPNLQNIPVRTDRGREIRKAFVPSRPDGRILSADYSQIELRVMAHFSGDAHLVHAFMNGLDVHTATAAKIFGISNEEVTSDQRRIAKTANFGIMYGISAFGLAQRLRIPRKEAQKIIDDYFSGFPSIQSFIERMKASARETGYVETLFGRRRYLPDIHSKNGTLRALAERNAVNAPIQGTAADIIKLAMIGVNREIGRAGLKSRMVLQIHDELVFDAIPEEVEALRKIIVDQMEHVVTLSVPLTVECNDGKNWLEAH
ncbi:MAG: DNA polymerase I [Bacteroidales bacterium]|jgi:DNA polymerase-1|nr:DNA polymerase I [Bacteroidales bacterium]